MSPLPMANIPRDWIAPKERSTVSNAEASEKIVESYLAGTLITGANGCDH